MVNVNESDAVVDDKPDCESCVERTALSTSVDSLVYAVANWTDELDLVVLDN